jgi:hypothetical protein
MRPAALILLIVTMLCKYTRNAMQQLQATANRAVIIAATLQAGAQG